MDLKDLLNQLSDKIAKQKDSITTEEATKTSFIMPMISALGYEVFNPFDIDDLFKLADKLKSGLDVALSSANY